MPSSLEIAGTGSTDTLIGAPSATWSNPSNITVDDANFAGCTASGGDASNGLLGTNFGFAIPGTATIDGVLVSWSRYASFGTVRDQSIRLIKGGSYSGADKAVASNWPGSVAKANYGGASDLWSTTLTPTDVNASDFGAMLQMYDFSGISSTGNVTLCEIQVTYTEASGGTKSVTRSALLHSTTLGALIK